MKDLVESSLIDDQLSSIKRAPTFPPPPQPKDLSQTTKRLMASLRTYFTVILMIFISSSSLSEAHPGYFFNWGEGGGGNGEYFGLFPEFYQYTCPQVNDIVMSVLERAIDKEPRIAASLVRLHFHDCFVQVEFQWLLYNLFLSCSVNFTYNRYI